jgi:hypothetical protein
VDNLKAGPVGYHSAHGKKYPQNLDSRQPSMADHGPTVKCQSSEKGRFITWKQAKNEKQFMEIG